MGQGIIDEMWRDATADILHAQRHDLLTGGELVQVLSTAVRQEEYCHHDSHHDSQRHQGPCQPYRHLLMVYLLLLLHQSLVVLILHQHATHAHSSLCLLDGVVQVVQLLMDDIGLLPVAAFRHQLLQRFQPQRLGSRDTHMILIAADCRLPCCSHVTLQHLQLHACSFQIVH